LPGDDLAALGPREEGLGDAAAAAQVSLQDAQRFTDRSLSGRRLFALRHTRQRG